MKKRLLSLLLCLLCIATVFTSVPSFSASAASETRIVNDTGGIGTISTSNSTNYNYSYSKKYGVTWISYDPHTYGLGYTVQPYYGTLSRSEEITYTCGSEQIIVTITQFPHSFSMDTTSFSLSSVGETKYISASSVVPSNLSISATSSDPSWLTCILKGTYYWHVVAQPNDGTSRSAAITIKGGAITKTIHVTQEGSSFSVGTTSLSFSASGETKSISATSVIPSNLAVSATSNASWLSCGPYGTNSWHIVAEPNDGVSRSATITVKGGGVTKTVSVTQAGASFSMVTTGLAFSASGEELKSISATSVIPSNLAISATSSDPSWLTCELKGAYSWKIAARPNNSDEFRVANITVKGGGITKTITVMQEGKKSSLRITATAGSGGTVKGSGVYNRDEDVTLTATPNAGYLFDGWYENGSKIRSAAASYSFIATSDRTLEARFSKIAAPPTKPTSLSLSTKPATMTVDSTYQLKATTTPTGNPIVWRSSNTSVATVSSSGLVTAKAAGSVKITATANGKSDACTITVHAYVILRVGGVKAIRNGVLTTVDKVGTKPFKKGGKTMLPLRFVGEQMGGTVKYINDKKPITMTYNGTTVEFRLGDKKMKVTTGNTSKIITLDVPAQKVGGKTYVPLRAVSQALGFDVYYRASDEMIVINNPKMTPAIREKRLSEGKSIY